MAEPAQRPLWSERPSCWSKLVAGSGRARPVLVPLLVGSTRDEFTFFMALWYPWSGNGYPRRPNIRACWRGVRTAGRRRRRALPAGPVGGSVAAAYSAAVTDAYFSCVGERMVVGQAAVAPVYAYEFADPRPPTPDALRSICRSSWAPVTDSTCALPVRHRRRSSPDTGPAAVERPDDRLLTSFVSAAPAAPVRRTGWRYAAPTAPGCPSVPTGPGWNDLRPGSPVRVLGRSLESGRRRRW